MPKVSVIIPTYNRAFYIRETIDSVIKQSFQDFDIIIVDDGSTDSTKSIVDRYIKNYPDKIRYFFQKNSGAGSARNRGIQEATSGYIAFLDSDDLWLPQKLEKSIKGLKQNNFDWICTACYRISGKEIEKKEARYIQKDFLDNSGKKIILLKNGLFFFSSVPLYTCSILAKRQCFEKAGLFDEQFKIGEDTDMWLRFEEAGLSGGYLDEPLFIYRVGNDNITKNGKLSGVKEHIQLAKKHLRLIHMDKKKLKISYSNFLWKSAEVAFENKEYIESLNCIIQSLLLNLSFIKFIKIRDFLFKKTSFYAHRN